MTDSMSLPETIPPTPHRPRRVCLAWTGASGLPYGLRLLDCLLSAGVTVELIYSQAAQVVAQQELSLRLPSAPDEANALLLAQFPDRPGKLCVYGRDAWFSPVASGSNPSDAMVVCPCSMGTLASIAAGLADNLIERAADVVLKERRTLIMVPRETPFSVIHLENMLRLAKAGAVIVPPSPGFYEHPQSVADMVDFVVARILDQLRVPHSLAKRWGGEV